MIDSIVVNGGFTLFANKSCKRFASIDGLNQYALGVLRTN